MKKIIRAAMAAIFVYDGLDALIHSDDHVTRFRKFQDQLERFGVPPLTNADARLWAKILGVVTTVSGALLALGILPRINGWILSIASVGITAVNNPLNATPVTELIRNYLVGAGLSAGMLSYALTPKPKTKPVK